MKLTSRLLAGWLVAIVGTAAWAQVPNQFVPGQTLTAEDLNENFGDLNARVNTVNTRVGEVEQNTANNGSAINALDSRVSAIENQPDSGAGLGGLVTQLQTDVNALQQSDGTQTQQLGDLTNRTSALETQVTNVEGQVSDLNNTIGGFDTRISDAQNAAASANDSINNGTVTLTQGGLNVVDSAGNVLVRISVNGSTGQVQTFRSGPGGTVLGTVQSGDGLNRSVSQNPQNPGQNIVYPSLGGPEAGIYVRGTGSLVNGVAIVDLPAHFAALAAANGMTATLTPRSVTSLGLAIEALSPNQLQVRELQGGIGTYSFDFVVHAVRSGFENLPVVQ